MSKRINIQPYTPPEVPVYPEDAPILIAGIIAVLVVPIVFACFWMWE